jgi:hypothetical protein
MKGPTQGERTLKVNEVCNEAVVSASPFSFRSQARVFLRAREHVEQEEGQSQ